jgi:hypothetical protein
MCKLTDQEKGFLHLILRSPHDGTGWRNVSNAVWPLVEKFTRPELIEAVQTDFGGRLRLTAAGETVATYLV